MWNADAVVAELVRRGELRETVPGLVTLRGEALRLHRWFDEVLRQLALRSGGDEWLLPPAIPLPVLARADYFASFPQWLTVASHLGEDEASLTRLATADDPAGAITSALDAPSVALQPALCYHVYAALADSRIDSPVCVTCTGTCWRHERERLAPLERGWSFTMRELVRVSDDNDIPCFLAGQRAAAVSLAHRLGLVPEIEAATDPFFAPTGRGRAALQRVKGLKDELLLPLGGGRSTAAASFNHHERYFGDAFGITLQDGTPATTGCAAFGVERWVLASLVSWGVDARNWPELEKLEPATTPRRLLRAAAV